DSTLQINFSSNENSRAKLSMYSLNDKKILSERIRVKCGEHQEVSFPLISFPSGFYIVCIESKSHQISKKIRIN
ncbi:MAG: hypothetical protein PF541_19165, partial [Prolixibacteraceae bacterium]|nr:hypothetical protein [Prolixibacteraceae bacterium]